MSKQNEVNVDSGQPVVMRQWLDILRHMLGASRERRKRDHGFRNYFCALVGGEDYTTLQEMEQAGLVKSGLSINGGKMQHFHATIEGCEAIGLSKAAIKRAFDD